MRRFLPRALRFVRREIEWRSMLPLVFVFCFGVLNFAAHKAVIDSGRPMLAQVPWFFQSLGGRLSLVVEFVMLVGAMIMAAHGSNGWAWTYAFYTGLNGVSAWLIFSGRL